MKAQRSALFLVAMVLVFLASESGWADGVIVDKIYDPYVQPLEQEFEWRAIFQNHQPGQPDDLQLHKFSYGRSLNDRWFLEAYLVGEKSAASSFEIEAYEVEAKWQLTEQGEFWADWGMLFELEKERSEDIWEIATALLVEKEWGKWSARANLFLEYEWGSDIRTEWETKLNLQARYRHSRFLEPAIEFYSGEDTRGLGPVLLGNFTTGARNTIAWEAGAIFGLDGDSPDLTWRFLLDFEF